MASFLTNSFGGNNVVTFGNNSLLFWDGREDNIQNLIASLCDNDVEMGITDLTTLPSKLASSHYPALFTSAYGSTEVTSDKISYAIATFISSISSTHSRFDLALQQNNLVQNTAAFNLGSLTAIEQQGYTLFMTKYNCGNCHHILTNSYDDVSGFIDAGLDAVYTDKGRGEVTHDPSDMGKFKVPSLHNVALTAPYMHDGRFKTLDEVLEHYSHGVANSPNLSTFLIDSTTQKAMQMNISDADNAGTIAFLNTFTDNQMITDPKF